MAPTYKICYWSDVHGRIRTRERCSKCKGAFLIREDTDIYCPTCNTRPKTYYIWLYWHHEKGNKHRISRDMDGNVIDSHKRSQRLLESIRKEIHDGSFNVDNYIQSEVDKFRGKTLFPKWYEVKVAENKAPSHLKILRQYTKDYYTPFFGNKDLRQLRAGDIEDFCMMLPSLSPKSREAISPKTKKNILIEFKAFLNWLHRREVIARVPAFPVLNIPEPIIYPIDRDTQNKILQHVSCQRLKDIIKFLIYHPVRPGEARALQVEDVSFAEGFVFIRKTFSLRVLKDRKNKNSYVLPMSPYFRAMFERLCKDKLPKAFVFTNKFGKPFRNESLEDAWNYAKKMAGLGHLKTTLYQGTKHSWGTRAINMGIAPDFIQGAMGHSTREMTKRYARLRAEGLREVMERMEGLQSDGSQNEKNGSQKVQI